MRFIHRTTLGRPLRALATFALLVGGALALPFAGPSLRAQPADPQLPPGAAVVGEDEVEFTEFTEPVDLQLLVDFVSKRLGINFIMTDTNLQGQQVVFRAPMRVRNDQLLSLLQLLLETHNYTLTRDQKNDWYVIRPAGNLPIVVGGGELATTQVIPTPLVRPSALQPTVTTMLPADAANLKIAYVDELGVIVSTAPPRLNESVERIVNLILRGARDQRPHRLDLHHIAAVEARDRILELVGQGARGQARPGAGAPGGQPAAAPAPAGGSLSSLGDRLIVDRQGNSLIFRGDDAEAAEVRQFVQLVDAPSRLIIRRYAAGPMSPMIARYGEGLGLGPVSQGAGTGARAPGVGGGGGGAGADTGVGSRFVIDEEGGAFTYYGTNDQHQRVSALVDEFTPQLRDAEVRVEFYKLRHARAADVADLLTSLLDAESGQTAQSPFLPRSLERSRASTITRVEQLTPQQPAPATPAGPGPLDGITTPAGDDGAAGLTPVEGIAIIADEPNNQIILRAPVRQQAQFARIIDRLDQRRPQVQIEAQIVSVNTSKTFRLRVDTAVGGNDPGDIPFFTNFGLRGAPFDNITLPNPSGVTAAIIRSSYIPIIVNALQTQGEGRILSRPTLLVNDNEEASISSTRDEPFAQTSQVVGAPSQTSLGGTLSAGTTLTIRPQISDAGFVVLEFEVELSAFGERPNPDLPPTTDRNTFISIVTVPSDSTVVVGGFTFESNNTSVSKVPFIGDIPVIKHLFRDTNKNSSRQTVFVFLTPRVLNDPTFTDLRLISQGWMEDAGIEDVTPRLQPITIEILGFETHGAGGDRAASAARANDDVLP